MCAMEKRTREGLKFLWELCVLLTNLGRYDGIYTNTNLEWSIN